MEGINDSCSFSRLGDCSGHIIHFLDCQKDVVAHLRYLKVCTTGSNVNEQDLILYRAGLFDVDAACRQLLLICQAHRDSLGTYWKTNSSKCAYPVHSSKCKGDRAIDFKTSKELFFLYQSLIPVGSGICKPCRTSHPHVISTRSQMYRTTSYGDDTESIELANLDIYHEFEDDKDDSCNNNTSTKNYEYATEKEEHFTLASCSHTSDCASYFFPTQSTATVSSHEEWEPEMSGLEKVNAVIKLVSDGSFPLLRSQLTIPWESASKRTQSYYLKKADDLVLGTLQLIAPNQSDTLFKSIVQKNKTVNLDCPDNYLPSMIAAYQEADSPYLKRQILSLFASKYSKEALLTAIPGLTKHKIEAARKYGKVKETELLDQDHNMTAKLPIEKVQHFVSFVSQPQYVQDVAFGERILKLSTGQKIHIPDVVRTVIGSRIISSYKAYCSESNFEPLGRSSLYNILKQCSASQRKSLSGLDNTTADGITSFDKLISLTDNMEDFTQNEVHDFKDIQRRLRASKRYLSCDYRWHVEKSSKVADHCMHYALSDSNVKDLQEKCDHTHDECCELCTDMSSVIDDLEQIVIDGTFPSEEMKTEYLHDFQSCKEKVFQWKQHVLRTVSQEQAKHLVLENLLPNEIFIVMDWAMKFLPWFDREKQTDFYGKKGINWHVSVVLSRGIDMKINTDCYVHLFDSIPQGWYAVASIIESLLNCIKSKDETKDTVYLRSDNASCYHCGPLMAAIPEISQRTGLNISRYDFSEAQSGKDICDRRTAPMKIHAKRFGNEGNNITTAEELKRALESYSGIMNTHVYVAEVDFSAQTMKKCSIPNINMYNNFSFEIGGLRMWQAYDVGIGVFISSRDLKKMSNGKQDETNLKILEMPKVTRIGKSKIRPRKSLKRKHSETNNEKERNETGDVEDNIEEINEENTEENAASHEQMNETDDYTCGECGLTFVSLHEYNIHQDIGNHKIRHADRVKTFWSSKCTNIKESMTSVFSKATDDQTPQSKTQCSLHSGWSLKGRRMNKRFSIAVKDYLLNLFMEGEQTGRKYTPTEASKKIRAVRDENGNRLFLPEEWLSSQQVQGLFSRFVNQSGKIPKEESDDELNDAIIEITRQENELALIHSICQ